MTVSSPRRSLAPWALAPLLVGLAVGCLFLGYEPTGADADLLYRPLKGELARSLAQGRLPLWSDLFATGVPLAAESHVAAFYPPNWALYRVLSVPFAYRLAMWLHLVATAAATYGYARAIGVGAWGAALAGVAFALSGFSSAHSGHEPLYLVLPYLPLCLLASDRYAADGRPGWLGLLALAWGAQLAIGHFQVQLWTGGLALGVGLWRVRADRRPARRTLGLLAGTLGGLAIAAPQLAITAELTRVGGFSRSLQQLSSYAFPPSHGVQPALPWLFARPTGPDAGAYWAGLDSSLTESSFTIGTIPLILAIVGAVAGGAGLRPWLGIVAGSLVLATLPRWWPYGAWLASCVPGLGWFRCPGRYTVLASLGLALLAGRGLDRAIESRRFRLGMGMASALFAASLAWGVRLASSPAFASWVGPDTLPLRFGAAVGAWGIGFGLVTLWRRGTIPAWPLILVSFAELTALYHLGPVRWDWAGTFPEGSPILQRLAEEPGVGLVAGALDDLPVRAGLTTAYPYLGITPPPPIYLLEATRSHLRVGDPGTAPWRRRFGVTHGVWHPGESVPDAETIFEAIDPALDRVMGLPEGQRAWTIARFPDAWPSARVAKSVRVAPDWPRQYAPLLHSTDRDEVWYLEADAPPEPIGPRARSARLVSWDGRTAIVEHDGACDLVIRRTHYPGWTYRIDDALPEPVLKADGGLQAARLEGSGRSRVTFAYRPAALGPAAFVSLIAAVTALGTLAAGWSGPARTTPEGPGP